MGKSKFQMKAEKKIQTDKRQTKSRHVYYDEKVVQNGSEISKSVFVLLIGIILVGAGTGAYFLVTGTNNNNDIIDNENDDTTTTTTTTTTEDELQEGDTFLAHYKLWVADVSGPSGVIDTSAPPYQDSTTGDPLEFTTGGVIEGFKNNILGMKEGEEITFTLESGEGYTTGDLAYYRLTFWVQIVEIL